MVKKINTEVSAEDIYKNVADAENTLQAIEEPST
jgi:hypothetical protein